MLDLQTQLATLKRPSLLARAARFGVDDYVRERWLPSLLGQSKLPRHGPAIMQLLQLEAEIEGNRRSKSGNYRSSRHVEVLIAILGEARLMNGTAPDGLR